MSGCLITFVFLANFDTYSWFTETVKTNFTVSSTSQDDIIKNISITEDPSCIKKMIITVEITGNTIPEIYYEVTGDLYDYIQHINPIKVSDYNSNIGKADIYFKVIFSQFKELLCGDPYINGKIVIRALNGYIIDEQDIQVSKRKLREVFFSQIPKEKNGNVTVSDDFSDSEITNMITYLASYVNWRLPQSITASVTEDSNNISKTNQHPQKIEVPINLFEMSQNQLKITNAVTPHLQFYLNDVYNQVSNLVSKININNQKIYELETINQNLKDSNEKLELHIREIEADNQKLQAEKEELIENYNKLTLLYNELVLQNDNLSNEYKTLEEENEKLSNKNSALNKEIEDLNSSNSGLRTKLGNLDSQLNNSQKTINEKNNIISAQQQEIESLNAVIKALEEQLNPTDGSNDENNEYQEEIEEEQEQSEQEDILEPEPNLDLVEFPSINPSE